MVRVYYIPNGPRNIQAMFPGVNFSNVARYYIEMQDVTNAVIGNTTINELVSQCCGLDKIRVHFLNYLGTIDAINFSLAQKEHEAKSSSFERSTTWPLIKRTHGINRFNVKSNDTLTLSVIDYREEDMGWVDELVDSPLAFMEWIGTQGQSDDYIPLVVQDIKKISFKRDDRWIYEVIIEVKLSHDRIIIRN
jgi:hypothetical protein